MFRYEVYKLQPFGEELDYGNGETLFHGEFTSLPSPPPSFTLSEPGMITLTFYNYGLLSVPQGTLVYVWETFRLCRLLRLRRLRILFSL